MLNRDDIMGRIGSVVFNRVWAAEAVARASTVHALCGTASRLGLALAGATMVAVPALAQVADLGGATVASPNFNVAPGGTPATTVQNGTLQLNDPAPLTYAGVLQDGPGVFSLQKLGNSTLTLAGTSTYSGETVINTGTLAAGAANAFSANSVVHTFGGVVDVAGFNQTVGGLFGSGAVVNSSATAATLTLNVSSGTVGNVFGTAITQNAGTISLVKTGAGEQDQSYASTYTGGTTLLGGTLGVGNASALGTGNVTFNGPSTLKFLTGINLANNIVLTSSGSIDRSGNPGILSGTISGPGRLTYSAAGGFVTITGVNTYAGGTDLNGGQVTVGSNFAFGVGSMAVNAVSVLSSTGSYNIGNPIQLNAQLRVIAPDAPSILQLGGQLSGSGSLWLTSGSGTLQLNVANTYTGGTILSSGRLQVQDNLSLSTGNVLVYAPGGNPVVLAPVQNNLAAANSFTLAATLTVDTGGFGYALTGALGDGSTVGGLRKVGAGTLTLSNGNSFTGGTEIDQGAIAITSDSALGGTAGTLTLAGGDLIVNGTTNPAIGRNIVVAAGSGGAINVANAGNTVTIGSVVSGAGALGKTGPGTLVLNGVNTYSGGTTATGGTVVFGNANAFGTGPVTFNALTLRPGTNGLVLANNFVANNSAVDTAGLNLTLTGAISGTNFTKGGAGTLLLSGNNSVAGGISINGGTLAVGSATALGANTTGIFAGSTLQAAADNLTLANNFAIVGGAAPITIDTQANTLTLNGLVVYNNPPVTLNKAGSGTLVVNGSLGAGSSDVLNVNAGRLQLGTTGAIAGGAVNVASGATLGGTGSANGTVNVLAGGAIAPGGATPGVLTVGNLVLGSGSLLNYRLGQAGTVGGAKNDLINVTGALTLGGTLNVTAAPSFTNGTYTLINYGTLSANNGLAVGTLPSGFTGVVVVGGGTVRLQASGAFLQYWDGSGAIADGNVAGGSGTWNSANLNWTDVAGANNSTWAGQAAVFGTVGGTVNVVGAQPFSALTFNVDGYRLTGDGLTIATPATITTTTGTAIIDNAISGASSLTKLGSGTLVLNGANGFGDLGIGAGQLTLGSSTAAGTGGISMSDATTLAAGVSGLVLANGISTAGAGTINGGAGVFTLNGPISGPGSITSSGTGNLVLNGNNSFTNLGISSGTVTLGTNTAAGSGGISMAAGTALAAGVSGLVLANGISTAGAGTINGGAGVFTLAGNISGPGSITSSGTGNLVLNGANSFTNLGVKAGTVTVGTSTAAGNGGISLGAGSTLAAGVSGLALGNTISTAGAGTINGGTGTFTLNGAISGPGSITSSGTGNLVLNGANSFTNLGIKAGTVTVGTNTAAGAGGISLSDGTTLAAGTSGLVLANTISTAGAGTINGGAGVLTLAGNISGPGSITSSGTGDLVLNGANSFTNLGVKAGTVTLGTNTAAGSGGVSLAAGTTLAAGTSGLVVGNAISTAGAGTINGGTGVFTLNGPISGPGSITSSGTGNLVLNGNNSFTNLGVKAGTVTVGSNSAAGSGGISMSAGTTLQSVVPGVTLANAISLAGATGLNASTGTLTLAGPISGAGSVTKGGAGTLVLSGTNSYAGPTTVAAGTLGVNGNNSGAGAVSVLSGAALTGSGNIAGVVSVADGASIAPGNGIGTLTLGGLTLANNATLNYQLGQANVIGGTFNDLLQVNGNLTLGGKLNVTDSNAFGNGVYRLINYTGALTNNGLAINSLPGTFTGIIQTAVPGSVNLLVTAPGVLVQYWDGADQAGNGVIDGGTGIWNASNTNWTTAAPSTINSSWAGGVGVFAGAAGTVTVAGTQAFQGLQFATSGYTLTGGTLSATGGAFIAVDGAAQIASTITGPGSVTKQGAGTLTLNGNNSFINLGISSGTVALGTNTSAGSGGISLSDGTTLAAGVSGLVLANGISTAGAGTVNGGAGVFTLNGPISGPGSITSSGTGNLVLNGNNSFVNLGIKSGTVTVGTNTAAGSGGISMSDGTTLAAGVSGLVLANGISTAGAGTVNGGAGVFTLAGNISGPGSITSSGTGNLVLNGNNSFTNLGVKAGTVTIGTNTAAGSGGISLSDGTTLAAGVSGLVLANGISTAGAGTINGGAGVFTLTGPISGPGSITSSGTGNLVLNGNNSFTNLGIKAGTVTVGTNTAAGSGGISLNAGTTLAAGVSGLVLTNGISTAGAGTINGGAGVFTLNGPISGPGSITSSGTGNLVLNGNNSFTNLGIKAGTVTIGTNTSAGSGGISLSDGTTLAAGVSGLVLANGVSTAGAGTINGGTGVFTLNGPISGPGSITSSGTGNLVLNGNNSFVNLGVKAGTVTVGTNTAAGSGGISLSDGTTLAAGGSGLVLANGISTAGAGTINGGAGVFTLASNISGPGSITSSGTGNLVLNGNNSFTNLGIKAGTVTVGTNTAAGSGGISLNAGTTLAAGVSGLVLANGISTAGAGTVNGGAGVFTLAGNISGPGSITSSGTGNLVLNGNNSFTNLGVKAGTVTVGTNTAAGSGGISLSDGTTLAAGGSGLVLANGISTAGAGTVNGGAGVFTLNGPISGPGSITSSGTGNLVLNGANSFTNLGIKAGTVTVGTNTAAGSGGISLNAGTTLAAGVSGLVLANGISTAGAGTINGGAGVFTLAGNISGPGSITSSGTGNLVLNGNNSFTNLGVKAGTVTLGTNTAAGSGGISLSDGTTLAAGGSGLVLANGISTAGAGTVNGGAGVFTLNGPISGPGSITSSGIGNLVLNGNNSFTNLGIKAGTVTIGTNAAVGNGGISLSDGTTLAAGVSGLVLANGISTAGAGTINGGAGVFTLTGPISGPGSITSSGTGNLVLNGNNSFTNLGIKAGTVTVGTNTAAGSGGISLNAGTTLAAGVSGLVLTNGISTAGAGTINGGAGVFTLNGPISGPGSITSSGTGNLVLNGNNSFTNLGVKAGTVTLGTNTAAGSGGISLSDGTTLAAGVSGLVLTNGISTAGAGTVNGGAGVFTLNGPISGPGSITSSGTGNLVLNGNNSFTNLGIKAGTVTVGTNTAAGSGGISLNAGTTLAAGTSGLVVVNGISTAGLGTINNGGGTFTLNGPIQGPGSLTSTGAGTLVLGGTSSFAGPATVAAGTLLVNGALTNAGVIVNSGGTFGGIGSVASLTALAGGTVAPATVGTIGTLSVTGSATFQPGSIFAVDVTPAAADRLNVGGTASLAGTLAVSTAGGAYSPTTSFTILSANGGRTGTFSTVTTSNFAFNANVTYTANNVLLSIAPKSLVAQANGQSLTRNELNFATAFDAATAAGFNPSGFQALFVNGLALPGALNQLTGEIHSVERRVAMDDTRYVREAALDRLGNGLEAIVGRDTVQSTTGDSAHSVTLWARGVGSWGTNRSDGNGSRFSTSTGGAVVGADIGFNGGKVGALFSYVSSDVKNFALGQAKVESTGGAVYAGYREDHGIAAAAGAAYASVKSRSSRAITVTGLEQALNARSDGDTWQAFADVSYDLAKGSVTRIEPFARFAWVALNTAPFSETGGIAAVSSFKGKGDTDVETVGLRGSSGYGRFAIKASVGAQHTGGDRSPTALLALAGTNSYAAINATPVDKWAFAGDLSAEVRLAPTATFELGYSGVNGKRTSDNGVRGTLTFGF